MPKRKNNTPGLFQILKPWIENKWPTFLVTQEIEPTYIGTIFIWARDTQDNSAWLVLCLHEKHIIYRSRLITVPWKEENLTPSNPRYLKILEKVINSSLKHTKAQMQIAQKLRLVQKKTWSGRT